MATAYRITTRGVSLTLIASLLSAGPIGCASDPIGKPLSDPDAERERLGKILGQRGLNPTDHYLVHVRYQEAETRSLGKGEPSLYRYADLVQEMPGRPEARVSYARMLTAIYDRIGSNAIGDRPPAEAPQAVAWLTEAINKDPTHADYFLLRARCNRVAAPDDLDARQSDLDRAAGLDPADPRIKIERGRLALAQGQYETATHRLAEALASPSITPAGRSAAHAVLGRVAQVQRQADKAIAEYKAALADNPVNVDALYGRAMYFWGQHDTAGFQNVVAKIRTVSPRHGVSYFAYALDDMDHEDYTHRYEAAGGLNQAVANDPENPVFRAMVGRYNDQAAAGRQRTADFQAGVVALLGLGAAAAVVADMNTPLLTEVGDRLSGGDNYDVTFRNTRGSGRTLIKFTQYNQTWKRVFSMEGGEERAVRFHLPGVTAGTIDLKWWPLGQSPDDERRDAIEQ